MRMLWDFRITGSKKYLKTVDNTVNDAYNI